MDALGDRMKMYEGLETDRRLMPLCPVYARIDGRCFSSFTKGMDRPYDLVMTKAMIETAKHLVEATHAKIGYTQSDEISLVWLMDDPKSEMFFGGKVQKMASVLAGMATAAFIQAILKGQYADRINKLPHFDARVFSLPNKTEVANAVLWRELDATKNAISMAARSMYSTKELHKKNGAEMQEMMFAKGVNFNDYPAFFKRGTFLQRKVSKKTLSLEEWSKIPEKNRPPLNTLFFRTSIEELDMPRFGSVTNRVNVIFDGADPEVT